MPRVRKAAITVSPPYAVPGARVTLHVPRFEIDRPTLPEIRIADVPARIVFASERAVAVIVPEDVRAPRAVVSVEGLRARGEVHIGVPVATELHQVDSPAVDRHGTLYVTRSGSRGEPVPVSVFRVGRDGVQEPFVSGIVNATSMAVGADDRLYVSSRFDGKVYRVDEAGQATVIGSELGIACGLAFLPDGTLAVGDRSGTIFRLDPATGGVEPYATLPPSIAAFHLAPAPDEAIYVSGPTLGSYDHVYRVERDGRVDVVTSAFGRPQGLAVHDDVLHVTEAAAGWSGVYRVLASGETDAFVAGPNLIGLAFDPGGGFVVCSNDTAYRFDQP